MFSLGKWRLVRAVRTETRKQLRESGLSLIALDIAGEPAEASAAVIVSTPWTDAKIDAVWAKAEAAGELSDEVIVDLSQRVSGLGDGPVLNFFRRVLEWLKDPANQENILMIVKAVMMILLMFI